MSKQNGAPSVAFTGSLTIKNAEAVREQLLAALAVGGRISVDCSAVEEVDATFIQLLIAARRAAAHDGTELALAQPSDGALLTALRHGGFLTDDREETGESSFWTKGAA